MEKKIKNIIVSTDPETHKQKNVIIPKGCIPVEMKAEELTRFMEEIIVGSIFADRKDILQIFPQEIGSMAGVWRYVYPIKQGVVVVIVDEEKWNRYLIAAKEEEKKKEQELLFTKDISIRRKKLNGAKFYCNLAKGKLSRYLLDAYNCAKKNGNTGKMGSQCVNIDMLIQIVEKYNVDVDSLMNTPSNARSNREYENEIVGYIEVNDTERGILLQNSIDILCKLVRNLPIKKDADYLIQEKRYIEYIDTVKKIKQDAFTLLVDNYKETDDTNGLLRLLSKKSNTDYFSFATYNALIDYFQQKGDEDNLIRIVQKSCKKYPEVYGRLIKYYRLLGNATKERLYIRKYITQCPDKESFFYSRLVDLGERKANIVPPESHMDSKTIPVISLTTIDSEYPCEYIKGGGYYAEGRRNEAMYNYKQAVSIYEALIASDYDSTSPFKRLMIIYKRFKLYDDEIRIINLALRKYGNSHLKIVKEWNKRLNAIKKNEQNT